MAENAASARSVEGVRSVSMADDAPIARSVEGAVSVSMADDAASARSVEGAADSTQAQSVREQKMQRPYRDQSAPGMQRTQETKMMTSPLRLGLSLTALLW